MNVRKRTYALSAPPPLACPSIFVIMTDPTFTCTKISEEKRIEERKGGEITFDLKAIAWS
jgi:hypothetical protein